MTNSELRALLPFLTARERAEMDRLLLGMSGWRPSPGQQSLAYRSPADVLFYGGAAGGGKTDLLLGLARNEHRRSILFRRVSPSLSAIIDRSREIFAPDADSALVNRFNEQLGRWRLGDGRLVQLGHLQEESDKAKHQGQARDFYGFDEITEFSESQFRFVIGWNRTTIPGQRCRVVCTGNPPTDSDGEWVIRFWAPWLDESHPRPAREGELRWFTTIEGKDVELPNGDPIDVDGGKVRPLSRTFIHARLEDNPFLRDTDYLAKLNALPEPLRSKFKLGDFRAGREDNAWQVIPSAWVDAAQARWRARPRPTVRMSALGVDVARGGKDKTIIAPRYGNWFDELRRFPGKSTPDGQEVAELVISVRRDDAVVNIDVIGVGSSPYDCLRKGWVDEDGDQRAGIGDKVVPMNGAEGSDEQDQAKQLGFVNQRAEWWWRMREALDPGSDQDLALPPDTELKSDLCAPRWKPTARGIQIESKDDIHKRIQRSPDAGDAVVNAHAIKQLPGMGWAQYARDQVAAAKAAEEKRK